MICRLGLGSMTYAVMGQNSLGSNAIHSKIIKLDPNESKQGCAYGLDIKCEDIKKAMRILRNRGVVFSEIK